MTNLTVLIAEGTKKLLLPLLSSLLESKITVTKETQTEVTELTEKTEEELEEQRLQDLYERAIASIPDCL